MKRPYPIIFVAIYSFIAIICIVNFFIFKKNKVTPSTPTIISTDTVYMKIDSLESKRDTIKLYYEKKVSNYRILPTNQRVELFAERISR